MRTRPQQERTRTSKSYAMATGNNNQQRVETERGRQLTVNVDQIKEDGEGSIDDASLSCGDPGGVDSDDTVEEDRPLAKGENSERDDDEEVAAPNSDGAKHKERGGRSNGGVAHQLVEDVEGLAVELSRRVESDIPED